MDDWDALTRSNDADADLYQQAIPRVKRRLLMQQRRRALVIGWGIAAILGIVLGLMTQSVATFLLTFSMMAAIFTLAFFIDYYRMDEAERRQRWLAAELDKEVEQLRRQQRKLKHDTLYRLGDDGELVEVEGEYLQDEPVKRKRLHDDI